MTDKQIRDRIMGTLSVSMMSMETEAECIAFLDRCLAADTNVSSKWISVKDKLPTIGQRVIVCRKDGRVEQGVRNPNDWWKVFGANTRDVTHWMPMPEPPKEV